MRFILGSLHYARGDLNLLGVFRMYIFLQGEIASVIEGDSGQPVIIY